MSEKLLSKTSNSEFSYHNYQKKHNKVAIFQRKKIQVNLKGKKVNIYDKKCEFMRKRIEHLCEKNLQISMKIIGKLKKKLTEYMRENKTFT